MAARRSPAARLAAHPWPILGLLGAGLGIRLVLALVVFPNQGLATDLRLFGSWASTLAAGGPGTFYASAGSANYPPGYLYVLWLVGALGNGVALLKLPAILADVAIGAFLYWAGRRWFGERAGLIAAALYLLVPVTWYDSALWGQVDAVGTLVMLASIVLLVEGWSEPSLADVPLIGQVAGLVGLIVSDTGQFSVLTANAFNAWALAGAAPLSSAFDAAAGSWTPDSMLVVEGISAATLGTVLLVSTGLLVAAGFLRRDGPIPILLGFALVAFAFYALPTRVHERYLLPFFAPGALLAAVSLSWIAGYVAVGLLNTANLHAVLGAATGAGFPGGLGGGPGRTGGVPGGAGGGRIGGFGAGSIQLPFTDVLRSEPVIALVAIGQTVGFVVLLIAWLVVLARPAIPVRRRAAGPLPEGA